ncbi:MAG: hypothetical protein C0469_15810 [Cyanobacteria bacterium DS2.3.42]|nr:hypothetical protein [Cyanobacteria bacterium DS2.3.42]
MDTPYDEKATQFLLLREVDRNYQSAAPAPPLFQHDEEDWAEAEYSPEPPIPIEALEAYARTNEFTGSHLISKQHLEHDRSIQVEALSHWKVGKQKNGNDQSSKKFESSAELIKEQASSKEAPQLDLVSKNIANNNLRILQNYVADKGMRR